jgi:glutamate/tyrosine decarboxylase-like PLP-dependent enzyme
MHTNKDLQILQQALGELQSGFGSFPDSLAGTNEGRIEEILCRVAERMHDNYPYFQPDYAGQMLKPPHAVARLAYMLALYINPNNHALDGGRASSAMEKEAVAGIAAMFGWQEHLGHLSSGGTMANLEALWVAGKCHPGKKILASEFAHYTHERISGVLGLAFQKVSCDKTGRMDISALTSLLERGDVGTVVVTIGTTGLGAIDPMEEILELQKRFGFRIHIDSAYGGYFGLAGNLSAYARRQFAAIHKADSIVIDPHKHGLQPYGCGCVLFRDLSAGKYYKHDSPYTYFSSSELHLGEISLECSRAGASAVALWATMQLFPLQSGGEFAQNLDKCLSAALKLYEKICADKNWLPVNTPELDIVVWAPVGKTLSAISQASQEIFDRCAAQNLHLALINIPARLLSDDWSEVAKDQDTVSCLRSCLMKPEHLDFVDELFARMNQVYRTGN